MRGEKCLLRLFSFIRRARQLRMYGYNFEVTFVRNYKRVIWALLKVLILSRYNQWTIVASR